MLLSENGRDLFHASSLAVCMSKMMCKAEQEIRQTIHPSQWEAFISLAYSEMDRAGQKTIPYLLVEEGNA